MLEFSKSTVPVDKKGGLRPEALAQTAEHPHARWAGIAPGRAESTYIHSNLSRFLLGTIGYIS